jgi:hypothetical protein
MNQCEALRILRSRALHNTERSLREGGQCLLCGYGALIEECLSPEHVFCDEECQASLWGLDHFFTIGFKRGAEALVEMASHATIPDAVLIRFFEWAYRHSLRSVEEYEELLAMRLVSEQFRRVMNDHILPGVRYLSEAIRRSISPDALREFTGLLPLIVVLAEKHLTTNAVRVDKLIRTAASQKTLYFLDEAIMTREIGRNTHYRELDDDRVKLLYVLYSAWYSIVMMEARPDESVTFVTQASIYSSLIRAIGLHEAYLRLDTTSYAETPQDLQRLAHIVKELASLSDQLTRLLPEAEGNLIPGDSDIAKLSNRVRTVLWDAREDLRRMVTIVIRDDFTHLRTKDSAWRAMASDITLSHLMEPSRSEHAEIDRLFSRVRNYAMARNIYLTHMDHPHSLVVAKCGLLHTVRGRDSMMDYLDLIYRMASPSQLEVIQVDEALDYHALVARLGLEDVS